jgi:hypothetical protein
MSFICVHVAVKASNNNNYGSYYYKYSTTRQDDTIIKHDCGHQLLLECPVHI